MRYGLITTAVGLVGATIAALTHRPCRTKEAVRNLVCGGAVSLIIPADRNPTREQVLTFIAISYFFVNAINLGVYLYTPELYPTRMRAIGVGGDRLAATGVDDWPTAVGFMMATGLQSVFLACGGARRDNRGHYPVLFAIETKQRVLEEVSP